MLAYRARRLFALIMPPPLMFMLPPPAFMLMFNGPTPNAASELLLALFTWLCAKDTFRLGGRAFMFCARIWLSREFELMFMPCC